MLTYCSENDGWPFQLASLLFGQVLPKVFSFVFQPRGGAQDRIVDPASIS